MEQGAVIVTQTPLRISLGGGSTDVRVYYEKFGGFIFGVAINFYIHVFLKRLRMDRRIQFHYTACEVVETLSEVRHELGKEALRMTGVDHSVSITFNADTPAGTGLGSSGSYAVGLLNGLYALLGETTDQNFLAEQAFKVTDNLGWEDGKQDPYLAAHGGFTVLNINMDGHVEVSKPIISIDTIRHFLSHTLLFYTGVVRIGQANDILKDQRQRGVPVLELKHRTKCIGFEVLQAFEAGDLDQFGRLMDQHWEIKRQMSSMISSAHFDGIYRLAKANGALGGKLLGAGGGGYFMFYCPDKKSLVQVKAEMLRVGLIHVNFGIDYHGSTFTRIL
jgi:D-glycero-alpha-D-manno-heptose-7-phosphate kinase